MRDHFRNLLFFSATMLLLSNVTIAGQGPQGRGIQGHQAQGQPAWQGSSDLPVQGRAENILPRPFPELNAEMKRYRHDLLHLWEQNSAKVQRFRCDVQLRKYDAVFGPRPDPVTGNVHAWTVATGKVKFAEPDKGMYDLSNHWQYQPPKVAGGEPDYKLLPEDQAQRWICNGKNIFEFDFSNRRLLVNPLPEHMQGSAIVDGPLPFLFGTTQDKLLARYWVRPLPSQDGQYRLEAFPKRRDDALNYSKVEVILDSHMLPEAIVLFDANFDPRTNPSYQTFEFTKREFNWQATHAELSAFHREFDQPQAPDDWEWIHPTRPMNGVGQPVQPHRLAPQRDLRQSGARQAPFRMRGSQ